MRAWSQAELNRRWREMDGRLSVPRQASGTTKRTKISPPALAPATHSGITAGAAGASPAPVIIEELRQAYALAKTHLEEGMTDPSKIDSALTALTDLAKRYPALHTHIEHMTRELKRLL